VKKIHELDKCSERRALDQGRADNLLRCGPPRLPEKEKRERGGRREGKGERENMIRRYQTAGVSPKDQERRRKDGNPRRPKPPNLRVADPWANWIAIYIECAWAECTRAQRFRQSQHWLSRALPSPWSPPPHESKVQVRYAAEEPSSAHIVPVIPYTRLIMDRINEPRDARTCDFLRLDAIRADGSDRNFWSAGVPTCRA